MTRYGHPYGEGRLLEATYRAEAERTRQESIQDRFDRLSERLSDRDET
ncbi:hypothetical protein SAMN05192552_100893 [Natrinema hispanicum]|uniref:Uncharacterized protein n=1 Tax=Natrinema hispanicum TaxID=392421 RepID=A0A1I0DHG4_9EURY|nr:hypothetical protein SAMN05192552_100893 [Natrinema hispanicum]SET31091.1 hypothetical protein SAMN04488694_105140 [Natrinema hispanicum]